MKKLTFIILCLEGAILSFNVAASAALIPSISNDFGMPQFIVGKIIWLYMIPYGLSALVYGPIVRAFDAKKIEIVCFFFFSLANLWAGLSRNITSLFAARFLMGVFGASVIPLVLILIGEFNESKKRGKLVGLFFSSTFIASLLGLFLSGTLAWRLIFLIPAAAGFLLLFIMYLYLPAFAPKERKLKINYAAAFKNKAILYIFTYIFFISLLYHGIQQWLSVYFSIKLGLGQFLISMLITLTSLSGIFGEALGGLFSDSLGRLKTANLGIALMIISVFLLIFKIPVIGLGVLMIAWGLGWTFNHAGISTILTDMPKEFLNEAASLNSGVRFISGGLGAALGGIIMQKNFEFGFLLFALCLLGLLFLSRPLIADTVKIQEVK
ncbi:MAG: MFS transporter [Candidatus Omnitrophica bacterium]|nr:MFS transporter [Candidatus Omnitrophota bacterium]